MSCKQETMLITTGRKLCNAVCECSIELFFRETHSLNYADNDRTCDHGLLTMLLGNAPQSITDGLNRDVLQLCFFNMHP